MFGAMCSLESRAGKRQVTSNTLDLWAGFVGACDALKLLTREQWIKINHWMQQRLPKWQVKRECHFTQWYHFTWQCSVYPMSRGAVLRPKVFTAAGKRWTKWLAQLKMNTWKEKEQERKGEPEFPEQNTWPREAKWRAKHKYTSGEWYACCVSRVIDW